MSSEIQFLKKMRRGLWGSHTAESVQLSVPILLEVDPAADKSTNTHNLSSKDVNISLNTTSEPTVIPRTNASQCCWVRVTSLQLKLKRFCAEDSLSSPQNGLLRGQLSVEFKGQVLVCTMTSCSFCMKCMC